MFQYIPWSKVTLTGRLFSVAEGAVTVFFLIQCFMCMVLDICIYFAATVFAYKVLLWALFTPAERGFSCSDASIREPLYPDTVQMLQLLGITLAGPFFVIVTADFLRELKHHSREFAELVNQSIGVYRDYVLAFWLMTLVVDVAKCFTGRLRPNFLALCEPRELLEVCIVAPTAFVRMAHCQTTDWKHSKDSKLSFPSGHAATSTFCALFLFFYLRGLQRRLPYLRLKILFWVVSPCATTFAVYCCITRVTDCWHFPSDVAGGVMFASIMFYLLLHEYIIT